MSPLLYTLTMRAVPAKGVNADTVKAMILAAGRGKRMGALTDHTPKPLLLAGGKPLIEHLIERLCAAGIKDVVINLAYLGDKIQHYLGDGERLGVSIVYSWESSLLETGGAVNRALPVLGGKPFLLINADVWTDFALAPLAAHQLAAGVLGHIVLIPNPSHNQSGDFALDSTGNVISEGSESFTFSGISLLHPHLIENYPRRRDVFPLREALDFALANKCLTGEIYTGDWRDIGTPERLRALDTELLGTGGL